MSDEPPQISILDARLAEIDKRLRTIQTGLVADSAAPADPPLPASPATPAPAPPAPPAADTTTNGLPPRVEVPERGLSAAGLRAVPAPASLAEIVEELRELAAAHEDLLVSMRGLHSDYERALAAARSAPADMAAGEDRPSLTVTAGPFPGTEAVRGFERALTALPGVRGVELRGYESGNRAVVDVRLSPTTS